MPTPLHSLLVTYLTELKNQAAQSGTTGELSYRDYLGKFLRGAAEVLGKTGAAFTGEATTAYGRPDYEVSISGSLGAIGYVEAEAISADLGKLAGHAKHQNDRFKQNLHNFLLKRVMNLSGKFVVWTPPSVKPTPVMFPMTNGLLSPHI